MKKIYLFSFSAAMALFSAGICNAQTAGVELKAAPAGVTVDGKSTEWGQTMAYTSEEKVNYTISNDKENLYLVIKTKDPVQQSAIAGAGVTLAVDPKGRKKSSYAVTFPSVPEDKDQSRFKSIDPETFAATLTFLNKFGKVKVNGFKDIDDGEMSNDGSSGIKTALGYDESGYLVYEEAIPLALFHAPSDVMTKEWMFNVTLNPLQGKGEPIGLGGSGVTIRRKSSGGGKKGNPAAPELQVASAVTLVDLTPEVSFWGKFTLAK